MPSLLVGRPNIVKIFIPCKLICKFTLIPVKVPTEFLFDKLNLKFEFLQGAKNN